MYPHEIMHHPAGGFGFWPGGWPGMFWLLPPTLFLLLLLALLGALLWLGGRSILGRRRSQAQAPIATAGPTMPAIELLRQRYARGEIDGDTFQVMLAQLRASDPAMTTGGVGEGGQWQNV